MPIMRLCELAEALAVPVQSLIPTTGVDREHTARKNRAFEEVKKLQAKLEHAAGKLRRAGG